MHKFNKGDKVRINVKGASAHGTEGIVTHYNEHGHVVFEVTKMVGGYVPVGGVRNEWERDLELVDEPFKVGDLVHYDSDGRFSWDGIEGIVTKMVGDETYISVTKGHKPSNIQEGTVEPFSTRFFSKIVGTATPSTHDPVNHPKHYTEHPSGIECIEITKHMGFNLGNALKYIWRCDLKLDAIEDLEKAKWYIECEIQKRKASV